MIAGRRNGPGRRRHVLLHSVTRYRPAASGGTRAPDRAARNAAGATSYCRGPTVPVTLRRDDFTHPETGLPVAGFEYITDDHPPDCA